MSYAGERIIFDADSHLMELPDFLAAHADAATRALLPSLEDVGLAVEGIRMTELRGTKAHPPDVVAAREALGADLIKGPKWHDALGAFNGAERGRALDLLGFREQVIFSSFCAGRVFQAPSLDAAYGAAAAHNRAVAAYCEPDKRLLGVAMVPLDDPARALVEIDAAHRLGLRAVWIPARAPGGRSPGHPDHEAIWATLAERRLPFILHVGSSPLSIEDPWMNDGRPERESARGRAEVIGSKDLTVIHQAAQKFVSVLVLDGVLEQFPDLRGGIIEIGAGWVPDMLRRLDHAASIWARSEPHLAALSRPPSQQIREQLRFTPYPFEDVGAFIAESYPELYMFSSDYPHAEGGRDPIGRFTRSLAGQDAETRRLFFAGNFQTLYGAVG